MKKILTSIVLISIIIIGLITLTGCENTNNNNNKSTTNENTLRLESLKDINSALLEGLYDDEDDYVPLNYKIEKSDLQLFNEFADKDLEVTKVDDEYLPMDLMISCKDGTLYAFILGGQKIYFVPETDDPMLEIKDKSFCDLIDKIIKKSKETNPEIFDNWNN